MYPFGEKHPSLDTVYSFDLDIEHLYFFYTVRLVERGQDASAPQKSLPSTQEPGTSSSTTGRSRSCWFTMSSQPGPPATQESTSSTDFSSPTWTLSHLTPLPSTTISLVTRILNDVLHQHGHILSQPFTKSKNNYYSVCHLLDTILSVCSLKFGTWGVSRYQKPSLTHTYKSRHNLHHFIRHHVGTDSAQPEYSRYHEIIECGKLAVSPAESRQSALERAKNYIKKKPVSYDAHLLFTNEHILLCRSKGEVVEYTASVRLLDEDGRIDKEAVDMLMQAMVFAYPDRFTRSAEEAENKGACSDGKSKSLLERLKDLPLEMQDCVVGEISQAPIEAARQAALLDVGSPFGWWGTDESMRR